MTRNVFVSHRCDAYHNTIISQAIEGLLKEYGLSHRYGCHYRPQNVIGYIEDNVEAAAEKSPCYLAVIQQSWHVGLRQEPAKWPIKEFELWRKYHPKSNLCFGMVVDESVRPKFLDIIPCHPVTTRWPQYEILPTPLWEGPFKQRLWATRVCTTRIKKALKLLRDGSGTK